MIKSSIKIHDKFSVVIDITYDKLFDRKKSKYTTLTYLFIPESLNINRKTYPDTKFYNDVRLFLKYDTPKYTIDDIYEGENSLLQNLTKNTEKFFKDRSNRNRSVFRDQVKMFASTFGNLLGEEADLLIKAKTTSSQDIDQFLEKISIISSEFRVLLRKTSESYSEISDINFIFYADEHMSNLIELQLMKLFNHLKNKNFTEKKLSKIVRFINAEQKYKKQRLYDSPKDKNVNPDELLYKRNQLKKFIDSVLFLNQDIRKDGAVFEQTLLALSAGLAMVFSTGIAFYFQQKLGNFSLPFFIALVVAYMLKDRIKGLVSILFISRSNSFFYDYKIKITHVLKKKIGVIKENFAFVPLGKLGANIKRHRLKDIIIGLGMRALNEQIIQYKKRIIIYPKKFGNDLPDEKIVGLTDITRLNFHRFIQYMDDPKKDYILVKKGEVYNKVANKVYYINIIQKYYTEEGVEFSRYQVIMNRNGIIRIKEIELE